MEVTFETAALASAVMQAARVAPTKGAAFDKSAGIKMEIRPDNSPNVTIKSTDLEVTYLETLTGSIPMGEHDTDWRLPSNLISGIIGNLPLGKGETVTLSDDEDGYIKIVSGKAKAKIRYLSGDVFAHWEPFDASLLKEVPGFAARVAQASWACDKNMIPYTGVHITGTHIIATDRYKLVRVPCVVPVDEPITVPLDVVSPILKNINEARIASQDQKLLLMPDDHTQITAVIFDAAYPKVEKPMETVYPDEGKFVVNVEKLRNAMLRMMVLCKGERYPLCKLTIGGARVHVFMDVPEIGDMEDELEVDGADHDDFEVLFTPTYITDALAATNDPEVTFCYDRTKPTALVRINDSNDYTVWVVPRFPGTAA